MYDCGNARDTLMTSPHEAHGNIDFRSFFCSSDSVPRALDDVQPGGWLAGGWRGTVQAARTRQWGRYAHLKFCEEIVSFKLPLKLNGDARRDETHLVCWRVSRVDSQRAKLDERAFVDTGGKSRHG